MVTISRFEHKVSPAVNDFGTGQMHSFAFTLAPHLPREHEKLLRVFDADDASAILRVVGGEFLLLVDAYVFDTPVVPEPPPTPTPGGETEPLPGPEPAPELQSEPESERGA